MSPDPQTRRRALARGLHASVAGNAQAFGFSITITVTFGVVASAAGQPSSWELVGFALAAVSAFSLLNVVVLVLVPDVSGRETDRQLLIGTATDLLAVGAAVLTSLGIATVTTSAWAWLLAPFLAGLVYVLVQSLELGVSQRLPDDGER